jgi:hypothetical protein
MYQHDLSAAAVVPLDAVVPSDSDELWTGAGTAVRIHD